MNEATKGQQMAAQSGKCRGLWGRLFGHKFCARYDEHKESDGPSAAALQIACNAYEADTTEMLSGVLDSLGNSYGKTTTTYVHDVCVRCGQVVKGTIIP